MYRAVDLSSRRRLKHELLVVVGEKAHAFVKKSKT